MSFPGVGVSPLFAFFGRHGLDRSGKSWFGQFGEAVGLESHSAWDGPHSWIGAPTWVRGERQEGTWSREGRGESVDVGLGLQLG